MEGGGADGGGAMAQAYPPGWGSADAMAGMMPPPFSMGSPFAHPEMMMRFFQHAKSGEKGAEKSGEKGEKSGAGGAGFDIASIFGSPKDTQVYMQAYFAQMAGMQKMMASLSQQHSKAQQEQQQASSSEQKDAASSAAEPAMEPATAAAVPAAAVPAAAVPAAA
eukprot:2779407-Rhodomonas_salina.1